MLGGGSIKFWKAAAHGNVCGFNSMLRISNRFVYLFKFYELVQNYIIIRVTVIVLASMWLRQAIPFARCGLFTGGAGIESLPLEAQQPVCQ